MFFDRAAELRDRPRYRHFVGGGWREVSWATMATRVRQLAAGLLEMGVAAGDRVALLSGTRAEWMEIDFAILATGALTIPVYPSVLADECGYILANAGATVAFVENAAQRAKVEASRKDGFVLDGVPQKSPVRTIITIDESPGGDDTLSALLARGAAALERQTPELERRLAAMDRGTLATIVYTSGTTGPPTGVPQTHGNHLASVDAVMRLGMLRDGEVDLFFLPLAHSFARMIEYVGIAAGSTTVFARSIDTLVEDLKIARPHVLPAVPRVYEKVYARVMAARDEGSAVKRAIFDAALSIGMQRSAYEREGKAVPFWLQAANAVAYRLVFHRIHETLGGNIRFLLSGGAPLSPDIAAFFHAVGILILEGYGLTETTPALTVNRPDRFKLGTVGLPLDCCEIRIAEDGEILARGENVVTGYYKRPDATAEAWDAAGWFHTGDIGEFDADGFLRITDRKKDLIKTSGGKYVAPQKIENLLKLQPHISQAVVIGDRRKYCVALITLDAPEIERWASGHGVALGAPEATAANADVRKLIEGEVAAVNRHLASFESVKQFRILPHDFTTESGELTPSLKVKRKVVAERYADLIDEMYG
jgi:long-chain acyl-CoA synthetase